MTIFEKCITTSKMCVWIFIVKQLIAFEYKTFSENTKTHTDGQQKLPKI